MFSRGDLVTNGSSAGRLRERIARDPRWKVAGWRIENVAMEQFGGNSGMTAFVPDYLLGNWKLVPLDWREVTGAGLEERYVLVARGLRREVREVQPNVTS